MQRRHDPADISAAAQEYLLALRVMGSDGRVATTAELGRHVGVTTQAASEMCRRLAADGLVEPATGRGLALTAAASRRHISLAAWVVTPTWRPSWAVVATRPSGSPSRAARAGTPAPRRRYRPDRDGAAWLRV